MVPNLLLPNNMYVSSAKCSDPDLCKHNLKLFMYNRNNKGPSEEPWGAPQIKSLNTES